MAEKIWNPISDAEHLQEIIRSSSQSNPVLILKHSNRCALSAMAKNRLSASVDERLSYFIIDVIAQRPLSNALAAETSVRHESPQTFLFVDGVLIDSTSHLAINPKNIGSELDARIQI